MSTPAFQNYSPTDYTNCRDNLLMTYYVADFVLGLEISKNELNILSLKYSQPKGKYIDISIICEYIDMVTGIDVDTV